MTQPTPTCVRLCVADLQVRAVSGQAVVDGVSFTAAPGEVVALTGPSGSGKTTAALAVIGALPPGLRRTGGTVSWDGDPVPSTRRWRRRTTGYLGQDPAAALTPHLPVLALVAEPLAVRGVGRVGRTAAAAAALAGAGLDPERFGGRRPHQLSGGQAQRVALARALVDDSALLLLDEPTSGLDRGAAAVALERVRRRRGDGRSVTLLVSHDPAVVEGLADRVVPVGLPSDSGPSEAEDRTRGDRPGALAPGSAVLSAEDVCLAQPPGGRAVLRLERLVVRSGELVAVVGPSGSGKSTLLRALAGLHPPESGTLRLGGDVVPWDVRRRPHAALRAVALAGQDARGDLNPARTVRRVLRRQLTALSGLPADEVRRATAELLAAVGLPVDLLARRPGQLSGGQRQRVVLARALAGRPHVLLADEVTSALDGRTTARVLDALDEQRSGCGLSVVAVTHDPAVVARADRVLSLDRVDPDGAATVVPTPTARRCAS